jgi:hypothetical protein
MLSGKNSAAGDTNTVMVLSTPSSSTAAGWRVNDDGGGRRPAAWSGVPSGRASADLVALVTAASAGVHGALIVPHAHESAAMAVAFTVATLGLTLVAIGLALVPTPLVWAASAVMLLGVACAYLLSRTNTIPLLLDHPEPFDVLGITTSAVEVAAAAVAVKAARQPNRRSHP